MFEIICIYFIILLNEIHSLVHFSFNFRLLSSKPNVYFTNIINNKPSNVLKRYISEVKTSVDKQNNSGLLLLCSPWKLCTGVSLGIFVRYLLYEGPVFCKAPQNTRTIQRRPNLFDDSSKFDWQKLLGYLRPQKWLLIVAVAVSILFYIYFFFVLKKVVL